MVHHDEFVADEDVLPTSNPHVIEANLWRIPDLAEKFVYLNDDMYVVRPLAESIFFRRNDSPIAWLSKAPYANWAERETAYHGAWANLRALRPGTKILTHFPCALTKSGLKLAREHPDLRDLWSQTCRARDRSVHDIPPIGAAVNLGVADRRYEVGALPKALFKENIVRASTVEKLIALDLCFLCVNKQPLSRTLEFCKAVRRACGAWSSEWSINW